MSHQYSWSTDYCLSLTLKEIDWRVNQIVTRLDGETKFNASLHDKEIKTKSSDGFDDLTDEQEALLDQQLSTLKEKA